MVIMTKKNASSTLYFIFFFIIFLAFCAFAVDGAIVLTNRAKLQNATEMTALAAASEFNYDKSATNFDIEQKVSNTAKDIFNNVLKQDSLQYAVIDEPVVDFTGHRTVIITTHMVSQPFFLRFLGVSGINLEAHAKALSEQITARYSASAGIDWLTKYKPYASDIIYQDSAILKALGYDTSASYPSGSTTPDYGLIGSDEGDPLSLGAGGFITIKLPAPIVDKEGDDLYIREVGNALEGYMVFAGIDFDPNNPYGDYKNQNGKLKWINISCTGDPETPGYTATDTVTTNSMGAQTTFYGSGYFDISKSCDGHNGIHMAKYIRIVDDNSEQAFVNGTKVWVYGESSTPTAGADIDAVKVLNHVRLE